MADMQIGSARLYRRKPEWDRQVITPRRPESVKHPRRVTGKVKEHSRVH